MTATPAPPAGAPAGLLALLDRLDGLRTFANEAYSSHVRACRGCEWGGAVELCSDGEALHTLWTEAHAIATELPALLTAARRGAETP